eukprot:10384343-Alexandrium_andersonii.AAC.1
MSASLVGSEMCIRDRASEAKVRASRGPLPRKPLRGERRGHSLRWRKECPLRPLEGVSEAK